VARRRKVLTAVRRRNNDSIADRPRSNSGSIAGPTAIAAALIAAHSPRRGPVSEVEVRLVEAAR
jgi:hypothetical protein